MQKKLTVNDKNNTSTRPRSFCVSSAIIITSIVTSYVHYVKYYICRIERSAVIFIFGLIESSTSGINLDDTPVDLVCVVYDVTIGSWKKRSSPGYVHRVPNITSDFEYCNGKLIVD